jgi:flagellar hook assembly protein FlgD
VFNVSGMRVRTLMRNETTAGTHLVSWDGRDESGRRLAPGLYVMHLRAGSVESSRRMFLVP